MQRKNAFTLIALFLRMVQRLLIEVAMVARTVMLINWSVKTLSLRPSCPAKMR